MILPNSIYLRKKYCIKMKEHTSSFYAAHLNLILKPYQNRMKRVLKSINFIPSNHKNMWKIWANWTYQWIKKIVRDDHRKSILGIQGWCDLNIDLCNLPNHWLKDKRMWLSWHRKRSVTHVLFKNKTNTLLVKGNSPNSECL